MSTIYRVFCTPPKHIFHQVFINISLFRNCASLKIYNLFVNHSRLSPAPLTPAPVVSLEEQN